MQEIKQAVYPSNDFTVFCVNENDEYGGAHEYEIHNCVEFKNGKTQYIESVQNLRFVKVNPDGTTTPGLQDEQLIIMLIDRQRKLNDKYPSPQSAKKLAALNIFLDACRERVDDRIKRGVMGELKV